jgi:hypothetical protein
MNSKDLIEGATQGVAGFLFHHPHSVVEPAMNLIADRVAKTVESWLDSHEDEIIEAIAKKGMR